MTLDNRFSKHRYKLCTNEDLVWIVASLFLVHARELMVTSDEEEETCRIETLNCESTGFQTLKKLFQLFIFEVKWNVFYFSDVIVMP